jgi:putative endonuclease
MPYFVYILRCRDGSLYTGSTNDVVKRFAAHKSGAGAKYTRSHPPEKIVFQKKFRTKGAALRYEIKTKNLSRAEKLKLIS